MRFVFSLRWAVSPAFVAKSISTNFSTRQGKTAFLRTRRSRNIMAWQPSKLRTSSPVCEYQPCKALQNNLLPGSWRKRPQCWEFCHSEDEGNGSLHCPSAIIRLSRFQTCYKTTSWLASNFTLHGNTGPIPMTSRQRKGKTTLLEGLPGFEVTNISKLLTKEPQE
jgi:hypothetical protein